MTIPFKPEGEGQTQAMLSMQKELVLAYEEASRAWLARMETEAELWSKLANKLVATRSVQDFMHAYQDAVSQRVQLAAEDARRLSEEGGKIMQKIAWCLASGRHAGFA